MQHFFGEIINNKVILSKEDIHHLLNVKRANIGEEIEVSFDGSLYTCIVSQLNPLEISVVSKIINNRELDIELTLAFAILKSSSHNELIVQKGTELGVNKFIPVISDRCVVKIESKEDNKLIRLNKIAKEAAEQCRRNIIPEVSIYSKLSGLELNNYDLKLIAYEGDFGKSNSLLNSVERIKKGNRILVLIGPEGGFSDKEVEFAKNNEFTFVNLGRRILRAETSAIYACSVIASVSEGE